MNALPCIRCGKQLRNVDFGREEEEFNNQPYNGTAFVTSGHYGSTVFDEMHGQIEVNVCDVCLLDAATERRVLYYVSVMRREKTRKGFWVPDVDEERVRRIDREEHGGPDA